MKLGTLIAELDRLNPNDELVIAWPETCQGYGKWAGRFRSYRGYYDQLALTPSTERRTVGQVLADARAAVGATFMGWKGGDYVMSMSTTVWLADAGDATSLAIGAVIQNYESVRITSVDVSDYQGW